MSSTNDPSSMRWDPQARGGAGGWVETPGTAPEPTPWPIPGPMPAPEPTPEEPGPQRGKPALAAVAALLLIAVAGLVVTRQLTHDDPTGPTVGSSSPPGSTAPKESTASPSTEATTEGAEQAAALDTLLDSSAADRQKVVDAVRSIAACESVPDAEQALQQAAANRDSLVSRLDTLTVDLVDTGTEAVAQLRTAWRHSAAADRAFAAWGSSAEVCTTAADVRQNDDYDSGVRHSVRATQAKTAFIQLWNPIAGTYGLASRGESGI